MLLDRFEKLAVSLGHIWREIRRQIAVRKKTALGLLGAVALVVTLIVGVESLIDRFDQGEVIFKTVDVFPNINDRTYDLMVLSGGEVIPLANPVPEGEEPKEASGPRNNIEFTLTNSTKNEVLIDDIEANLVEYERVPDKNIVTRGPFAVLRPIDLFLKLQPNRERYELLRGKYVSIASGMTEHVFRVWVSGSEPGVYRFKINIKMRLGGVDNQTTESDMLYSFAVPEENSPECNYLYRGKKDDPNFAEILRIADKPLDEFKQITASWGKYKLMDALHNMPVGLMDFMGNNIEINNSEAAGNMGIASFERKASEIVLSEDDYSSVWSSAKDSSGNSIYVSPVKQDLPEWFIKKYNSKSSAASARTIKIVGNVVGIEVIYNTVAIYLSADLARRAFLETIPPDRKRYGAENNIGDEFYQTSGLGLEDSMRIIVFRKGNIVVSLVGMPGSLFLERYAKILEGKIQ